MNPIRTTPISITVWQPKMGGDWKAKTPSMRGYASSTCSEESAAVNLAKRWFFGAANGIPIQDGQRISLRQVCRGPMAMFEASIIPSMTEAERDLRIDYEVMNDEMDTNENH